MHRVRPPCLACLPVSVPTFYRQVSSPSTARSLHGPGLLLCWCLWVGL